MESIITRLIDTLPHGVSPTHSKRSSVIIDETEPMAFWSHFIGALEQNKPVTILDPAWPEDWKSHYRAMAEAHHQNGLGEILIPTSGTSGKPSFCRHNLETLEFAARSFAKQFQSEGYIHAIIVLPANHIGGLMPVFRSTVCGGKVEFTSYRQLELGGSGIVPENASISLVPTQLRRMMDSTGSMEMLKRMGLILMGGAACPDPVLRNALDKRLRLAPCYGSTETAAMVTVLNPDAFLDGETGVGRALPDMAVSINKENRVVVTSNSIQLGYVPAKATFSRRSYITSDIGQMNAEGNLWILGRSDRIIISGGKKVIPEQVEAACWESGMVADVQCHGVQDPEWGERVKIDVVLNDQQAYSTQTLITYLRRRLPAYAVPKDVDQVRSIERNVMGKHRS